MLWALSDPRPDQLLVVTYPYFETSGVLFTEPLTYVAHEEPLSSPDSVSFNHGLAEIITALMEAGLTLTAFEEHDSVPWEALGDAMVQDDRGEFRLRDNPLRLAASYTLQARKAPATT